MEVVIASIGSAFLTGAVTIIVNLINHNKSMALVEYQINELKKETQKHNSIIERTYALESKTDVLEAKVEMLEGKVV